MRIVPLNKFDFEACKNLASASEKFVVEKLDELLIWLQDMNWPVAPLVLDRLKSLEKPLILPLQRILNGDDDIWKYWIVSSLLKETTPTVVTHLEKELIRIVKNPTKTEKLEEVNVVANELLSLKFYDQ